MILLYLFIAGLLVYLLLFLVVPKATNLHEILRLPLYQFRMQSVPTRNMEVSKHIYGQHRRQYFLHCRPKTGQKVQQNVVVYYHGGGWAFGTPELFRANAQCYINLGYEVFLPSYRRIPTYRYSDMQEDLSLTLKHVLELMPSDEFPSRKIILGGMSAGGHLVASILHNQEALAQLNISQNQFAGMLLFAAPLDLGAMKDTFVLRLLANKRNSQEFHAANPIDHLSAPESIPVLCVHGTKDGFVNYQSSINYLKKREEIQKGFTQLFTLPNGTHMDAGNWNFFDDELKREVIRWLKELE